MDAQGGDDGGEIQDCGRGSGSGEGGRRMEFGDRGTVGEGKSLEFTSLGVTQVSAGTDDGHVVPGGFESCGARGH